MDPPVNEEKQIFNMIEISKFRSLTMGYSFGILKMEGS